MCSGKLALWPDLLWCQFRFTYGALKLEWSSEWPFEMGKSLVIQVLRLFHPVKRPIKTWRCVRREGQCCNDPLVTSSEYRASRLSVTLTVRLLYHAILFQMFHDVHQFSASSSKTCCRSFAGCFGIRWCSVDPCLHISFNLGCFLTCRGHWVVIRFSLQAFDGKLIFLFLVSLFLVVFEQS